MTALSARDAALRIQNFVRQQPPLRVPLDDALGSILAEPVASPINVPFRANSAMDGYAVRAADIAGASPTRPARLRVVDRIAAGSMPSRGIEAGECARIFTGAPPPPGADSVVRQEDTDLGEPLVAIHSDRDARANIRPAGEDLVAGSLVLSPGHRLGPAELGILASIARDSVVVYRRPRVALLGSGDEVVDVDRPEEILSGRKVGSSNSHSIRAAVREAGGEPVDLGIARDDPEDLCRRLAAAAGCDLLVTTAGVSVSEHDHLRRSVASLGGRLDFWRIRMRPGAPVGFGAIGETPWIGLPGNPVSALVTFELLVRPAIRAMMGHPRPFRRLRAGRTVEPIRLVPRLQHFLRAVTSDDSEPTIRLTGPQGSGILSSLVQANSLAVVPEGQHDTPVGAILGVIRLDDPGDQAQPPY